MRERERRGWGVPSASTTRKRASTGNVADATPHAATRERCVRAGLRGRKACVHTKIPANDTKHEQEHRAAPIARRHVMSHKCVLSLDVPMASH